MLSTPIKALPEGTGYRASKQTRFCTSKGWFAYRDLTPTMRRAILSADGGVGPVAGWVTTQTANALERMGLVEWRGLGPYLTHHGSVLWCEID
jgi:hypothetical protein